MSVSEKLRDLGRELMKDDTVKGVKLIAFRKDGRYEEWNSHFDPTVIVKKEKEKERR